MPKQTPLTVEELFSEATLKTDDVHHTVEDDLEDELIAYLESTRKISIFDSEFLLEGEM